MIKKTFYGISLLLLLTACSSQKTEEYHANINKGMEAVAEENYGKAEAHFETAVEMKLDDEAAEAYLQQVVLIQQAEKEAAEDNVQEAIDTLDRVIEYSEGSKIIVVKAEEQKKFLLAKNENEENRTKYETALSEVKKLTGNAQYKESTEKIDVLLIEDLSAFADIKIALEKLKEENTIAEKEAEAVAAKQAEQEKLAAQKKAAEQKAANDPYAWGPGIKEAFERRMIEEGYIDSISTIEYEDPHVSNGQGQYQVYGESGGTRFRIVRVNVKTGDYSGL